MDQVYLFLAGYTHLTRTPTSSNSLQQNAEIPVLLLKAKAGSRCWLKDDDSYSSTLPKRF